MSSECHARDVAEEVVAVPRITLYRSADCARCARIARIHRAFDWFHHLEDSTADCPGLGPLRPGQIAVEDRATGEVFQGVDAVRRLFREIPAYAPLRPLLRIPPIARRIDRETRGCEDGSCALPTPPGDPSTEARREAREAPP